MTVNLPAFKEAILAMDWNHSIQAQPCLMKLSFVPYTAAMRSVADDLRRRTIADVLDLTPAARVELALALGDDDLDLFVRTSGLDRDEARRRLRAQRQVGRPPSLAGTLPRP
jgi:hypothetical protein